MKKGEAADATPLDDGLSIPDELQRRAERKAKLAAARAEMEVRALARAGRKNARRTSASGPNAKPNGRRAKSRAGKNRNRRSGTPGATDQVNFTDEESRIMKAGNGQPFEQAYNAQAAVEIESRLIVAAPGVNAPNDKEQLAPTFAAIVPEAGPVAEALIDSGFVSEQAVKQIEQSAEGQPTGVKVLAAVKRDRHGRSVAQLEWTLVTLAYNLKRLFTLRAQFST